MTVLAMQPYAQALFDTSADIGVLHNYQTALIIIGQALEYQEFYLLATNKFFKHQVLSIIQGLIPNMGGSLLNFFKLLVNRNLLLHIADVSQEFDKLLNNKNNEIFVIMKYAEQPTDDIVKAHVLFLKKKFNKNIKYKIQLLPELIAGFRFIIDDVIIESSLQLRCKQLLSSLTLST